MNNIIRFYRLLLPFDTLNIGTKFTFSEVLEKLDEIVEPPKIFRLTLFKRPAKPYEGIISGNTFKISRIAAVRHPFLPMIQGEIHPQEPGSYLKISMNLHKIAIVILIYWLWATGSIGMFALFAWFVDRSVGAIFLPILGMFIFGWLLCLIPFKIEAKATTKFLLTLFPEELTD